MGGKLEPVYTGPYTVHDKGRYCLQRTDGTRLKKFFNGLLLKEVLDPVEQSDSDSDSDEQTESKGAIKWAEKAY